MARTNIASFFTIAHRCCIDYYAHPPYQRIFANFSDRALLLSARIPKTPFLDMRSISYRCCIDYYAHRLIQRILATFSDRALFLSARKSKTPIF